MKVSKDIFIQAVINFIIWLVTVGINLSQDNRILFAILATIQLLVNIYLMHKIGVRIFSFSCLFVIFNYIFHFGEILLYSIGQEDYNVWNVFDKAHSIMDYNTAAILCLWVSGFTVTGILFAYRFRDATSIGSILPMEDVDTQISKVFNMGLILFLICAIPTIVQQVNRVSYVLEGGKYLETRTLDAQLGFFEVFTRFFPFAIMMLLIGAQQNKMLAKTIYILAVAYECICMISGNRSLQIIGILIYSYIYFNTASKITLKKLILIGCIGYVGLAVLNVIMRIRNFGATNFDVIELISDGIKEMPIFAVIGEFGGTLLTVEFSVHDFPDFVPFKYGISYLAGLTSIYPNTGGLLPSQVIKEYVYMYSFATNTMKYTLGGSYIGELFVNFGWLSIVLSVFVGVFIGKTCKKLQNCFIAGNWISIVPLLPIFYFGLLWVRGYFYSFIFTSFWLLIFCKLYKGRR